MAEQEHKAIKDPLTGVGTTGHVWDETLQEFDNPLPRWWLWAFYATIIFSIVYWFIYPSWPMGFLEKGYARGFGTVTFNSDLLEKDADGKVTKRIIAGGEEVTRHWDTRGLLAYEMQNDPNELTRQKMVKEVAATPFDGIASDPQKSQFVLAYGKGIFGDYCAGCHQRGGQGVVGHYPNLVDDAWLWGGEIADIETSIKKGRMGNMPGHKASLSVDEIDQAANYVLSLSGVSVNAGAAEKGKAVFNTKGCSGCHMPTGVGMKALGAANLTDQIWTQADVNGAGDVAAKLEVVKAVISDGIKREMPAWESRLKEDEIKILVSYIKLLSQN